MLSLLLISGIITIRKGSSFRFLEGLELSTSTELFRIQESESFESPQFNLQLAFT